MKDLELSILICSWNTLTDLRACLQSLLPEVEGKSIEVIVVDNNSEDGSQDMVANEFPWVALYPQYRNLGFTGGNNFGLGVRKGRHALLLNSDTIAHKGSIQALLDFLNSNPKYGIIGPKLLNTDGSLQFSCRKFPNPIAALFRNTPLGKLFPKNKFTQEYLMSDWDHSSPRAVDWVSGAALLISEDCLSFVRGLDPDFFMFCEDVDVCYRAHQAGFDVMYFPGAVITHKIGASTSKSPNRMIWRFHRSMHLFFKKHQLSQYWWPIRPFVYWAAGGALFLRASLFLVKNQVDRIRRSR